MKQLPNHREPGENRNSLPGKQSWVRLKKRLLKTAAATALLFFVSMATVFASHFRYGNVSWTRVSETSSQVTIRVNVNLS